MSWLIRTAARATFPALDSVPTSKDYGSFDLFLRTYMREVNWLTWLGLLGAGLLFMATPLFTVGRPLPACWLSASRADQHAARLASHPIYLVRQSMFIIKMVAGFYWGAHPAIREQFAMQPYTGDPGTWRHA